MNAAIHLLTAWLAADFASGLFHWIEDRYGDPQWPVLGPHVVAPNILHHEDPMAFTRGNYWTRNWTAIVPAAALAAAAAACGLWWWAAVAAVLSQSNEIHSWAHQRCSRPIRGLQLLGILQSPEQHAAHHRQPFDRNYCVMTDLLNPVLTAVGFWPGVELLLAAVGIPTRKDREVA
jgi:ubiquitin-conjugating enzyme E2 variant